MYVTYFRTKPSIVKFVWSSFSSFRNLFLTLTTSVISKFDPVKCTSPCFACYFVSTSLVKISINADKIVYMLL